MSAERWIDGIGEMTNRTAYSRHAPGPGGIVYEFAWRRPDGGWEFGKGATEEDAARALLTRIAEHHEACAERHAARATKTRDLLK